MEEGDLDEIDEEHEMDKVSIISPRSTVPYTINLPIKILQMFRMFLYFIETTSDLRSDCCLANKCKEIPQFRNSNYINNKKDLLNITGS